MPAGLCVATLACGGWYGVCPQGPGVCVCVCVRAVLLAFSARRGVMAAIVPKAACSCVVDAVGFHVRLWYVCVLVRACVTFLTRICGRFSFSVYSVCPATDVPPAYALRQRDPWCRTWCTARWHCSAVLLGFLVAAQLPLGRCDRRRELPAGRFGHGCSRQGCQHRCQVGVGVGWDPISAAGWRHVKYMHILYGSHMEATSDAQCFHNAFTFT